MKANTILTATIISALTFTASSAVAAGLSGVVNINSSVNINGKVEAKKGAALHVANYGMKGASGIDGNVHANLTSRINGDVIVGKKGRLEHASVNMADSKISGDLRVTLEATSKGIEVGNGAILLQSALDMQGSKVTGNLDYTSRSATGRVTLKDDAYANIASLRMSGSEINSGNVNLEVNSGNVQVDRGGKLYLSASDIQDSTAGRVNFTSRTDIGDVHVKKDGTLNVGSLVLTGGHYGNIDRDVSVTMPHGIVVDAGTEVEIGAVTM